MTSKKKVIKYPDKAPPKPGFWYKLFRFFFPKDWKGEMQRGIGIGKQKAVDRIEARKRK